MPKSSIKKQQFEVPKEVSHVTKTLKEAGFKAFLVGGCVRDLVIGRTPKDWDIATNANPKEIQNLFEETFYENDYGTVGVVQDDVSHETLKIIEVTPFRTESVYTDKRRPDTVEFSQNLEDDLKRRDFTINALAYDIEKKEMHDPYQGLEDIKSKTIKTVGKPQERFGEDALRMLRAIRLHAELGFSIESSTSETIIENSELLSHISEERIRDEISRVIISDNPAEAFEMLRRLNLLQYCIPELLESVGVEQGGIHAYDVWEHLLRSLQHSADKGWSLELRLASLLHDIGKPATRGSGKNKEYSFYGHEVVGAKIAKKILKRLHFSKDIIEKVTTLIRWHMFFADTEQITHSAVRRMISNVGKENIQDLLNLRMADRIGTGRPKENPYRLRKYRALVEEVLSDPVSVGQLVIDGHTLMEDLGEPAGPRIGWILHALLDLVLENPENNKREILIEKTKEFQKLSDQELREIGKRGEINKKQEEESKIREIRSKFGVE